MIIRLAENRDFSAICVLFAEEDHFYTELLSDVFQVVGVSV